MTGGAEHVPESVDPEGRVNWQEYKSLLPEDCVPLYGIRLITVILPDGRYDVRWDYTLEGTVTLAQMLGMIEAAKIELAHDYYHEEEGGLI